jgi:succinoglycan biosynthesis transport protein ExoP
MTVDDSAATRRPLAAWLLPVIRHQKLKVLGVALIAVVAAIVGEALSQPTYQAHATLMLKFGREYMYRAETGEGVSWSPPSLDRDLNTEVQILAGRDLQMRVLDTLGPATVYPQVADAGSSGVTALLNRLRALLGAPERKPSSAMAEALARFDADLVVTGVKDTNVVDLTYRNADPEMAARVLQLLLKYGAEKRTRLYGEATVAPLEAQLAADDREFKQAEDELRRFRLANRLYDADAQLVALNQATMELNASLASDGGRATLLRQAVAAIEARMRRLLGDDRLFTEQEPEAVRKAEQQLSDQQVQNAKVLLAVPRNTRMADRRRADEDALRAEVERQRGVAPDRLSTADQLIYRQLADDRYDLRSELAQAVAAQDADQQALAGLGQRAASLLPLRSALEALERRVANARNAYNSYAGKLADRKAAAALDQSGVANLRVLEEPMVPTTPVGLRPAARILIAGILGLLAGLGVGVWAEARGPAARRVRDLSLARSSEPLPDQPRHRA